MDNAVYKLRTIAAEVGKCWRWLIPAGFAVAAIELAGHRAPPLAVFNLGAIAMSWVLLADPFRVIRPLIAAKSCAALIAGEVMVGVALQVRELDFYFRICLCLGAALCWVLAGLKNADWCAQWRIKITPVVDEVVGAIQHDNAGEVFDLWDRVGCMETRAMLHLNEPQRFVPENLVTTGYMETFCLGAYHYLAKWRKAMAAAENLEARALELTRALAEAERAAEKAASDAEAAESRHKATLERMSNLAQERKNLIKQLAAAQDEIDALKGKLPEDKSERNRQIYDMAANGMSYQQIGAVFGLSKSTVGGIIKDMRAADQNEERAAR